MSSNSPTLDTASHSSPAVAACRHFEGLDELVRRLDQASQRASVEDITGDVKSTLTDMLTEGRAHLPAEVVRPREGGYARRLLYQSPQHGYVVIAMVWGPEQGTPLHDHDGVWCVEGVVMGEIEVTRYELMEHQGDRWQFRADETLNAHVGVAGTLIPPFEYHTIANPSSDEIAVTIHVYGREMHQASIFEPRGESRYERVVRQLGYN